MDLDIADIVDVDGMDGGDNDGGNVEEDVEEEQDKVEVLRRERLKIANRGRSKSEKRSEHSLEVDGIPGSKEDWTKLNLARSIMAKRFRKTYDQIRRKKTKKSNHLLYLESKRQRIENGTSDGERSNNRGRGRGGGRDGARGGGRGRGKKSNHLLYLESK